MNSKEFEELKRLNFEDFIWIIFIINGFLNLSGDYCEKEYIKRHDYKYKEDANNLFSITVIISFLIYLYFWNKNYKAYQNCPQESKNLFLIKLMGSSFLIAGSLCLLYSQFNNKKK